MTGIFKINNNEVFGSDGTFSGTIGSSANLNSATFPTKVTDRTAWYYVDKDSASTNSYDAYRITGNVSNTNVRIVGCAPEGVSSVVAMDYYVFNQTTSTGTLAMQFQIGRDGQDYHEHNSSLTNVASGSQTFSANQIRAISLMGIHASGVRFEDYISSGDVFGIRVSHPSVGTFRGVGIKIVWRF